MVKSEGIVVGHKASNPTNTIAQFFENDKVAIIEATGLQSTITMH
jgi:hypothetical protein